MALEAESAELRRVAVKQQVALREVDAREETTILEDVAAKFKEAEEALHAEERANLRSKVAGLKAKLDNLIQSNETAPDLEKMDRKELVIDFETRDELMAENEAQDFHLDVAGGQHLVPRRGLRSTSTT